jgi:hypothetical protein
MSAIAAENIGFDNIILVINEPEPHRFWVEESTHFFRFNLVVGRSLMRVVGGFGGFAH